MRSGICLEEKMASVEIENDPCRKKKPLGDLSCQGPFSYFKMDHAITRISVSVSYPQSYQ
ncbi:hypothetical protein SAMN05444412_12029 [Rhodonellum ikkaensis]|uniref:Uncharacterized protein n=1 Tax=Rhodonellum ikkaensis TaxID=336829 RepID=A0A1H3TQI4_9BACT|nr:hypothetical protein SAMN05444412_12029 [Rhodonellum ikkaensis]